MTVGQNLFIGIPPYEKHCGGKMKKAKPGDRVKIYYMGKTGHGDVFETAMSKPVEFTIGKHEVVTGLEKGVVGMGVGDKKASQFHQKKNLATGACRLSKRWKRVSSPNTLPQG